MSPRNIVMSPGPTISVHDAPTFDNFEEGEKSNESDRERVHHIYFEPGVVTL